MFDLEFGLETDQPTTFDVADEVVDTIERYITVDNVFVEGASNPCRQANIIVLASMTDDKIDSLPSVLQQIFESIAGIVLLRCKFRDEE
jgi:hypothetical protein